MIEYLTLDDVLAMVETLGVGPVRDVGLLDSAVHRPSSVVWGTHAYLTMDLKAAALLDSLVGDHGRVDGNKRLGWLATVVFYDINGVALEAPDDDAYDLVIAVAERSLTIEEIAGHLARWH